MKLEAVFFDCDGVISENEKFGHQIAFNKAFQNYGLNIHWDDKIYKELLRIGGGKERLTYYFEHVGWPAEVRDPKKFVEELHAIKSDIYIQLIAKGKINVRPGITELMDELIQQEIPFGICTTSKKESVEYLIQHLFPQRVLQKISLLLAGDMVHFKKPSPEVYLKAAEMAHVLPENCMVIEDSEIGTLAGVSAGMKVLVTKSYYTVTDNFSNALFIADDLTKINLSFILKLFSSQS